MYLTCNSFLITPTNIIKYNGFLQQLQMYYKNISQLKSKIQNPKIKKIKINQIKKMRNLIATV